MIILSDAEMESRWKAFNKFTADLIIDMFEPLPIALWFWAV